MPRLSVMAPVLRRTRRLGQVVAMTAACSVFAAGAAQAAEAAHGPVHGSASESVHGSAHAAVHAWHRWPHRSLHPVHRAVHTSSNAFDSSRFPASCPERSVPVACVDQNAQRMWVQENGKVVFPAVTVRTGRAGLRTPDGMYRIYWRHKYVYSRLFDEPMPYSLFFFRGYALHATYDDVRKGGSHGCVNLRLDDARRLFGMMDVGDLVYIWGHKHSA